VGRCAPADAGDTGFDLMPLNLDRTGTPNTHEMDERDTEREREREKQTDDRLKNKKINRYVHTYIHTTYR
jgi:hypothetical protein